MSSDKVMTVPIDERHRSMKSITTSTFPRLAALAAVPLLALALVGCGPSGPSESTSSSGAGSSGSSESASTDRDAWHLKFAACMRDAGVDYPDPVQGQGISFTDDPAFETASDACIDDLGAPPGAGQSGTGGSEADADKRLKIAQCLRDKGVEVEDPKEDGAIDIPADASEDLLKECGLQGGSKSNVVQG